MNPLTINKLIQLNNSFYAQVTESFSNTRQHAWPGMEPIVELVNSVIPATNTSVIPAQAGIHSSEMWQDAAIHLPFTVTDFACGNLRFEQYLADNLPEIDFTFNCIDNCPKLSNFEHNLTVNYSEIDIISHLIDSTLHAALNGILPADFTVSFGFLHHIPTFNLRKDFLTTLIAQTKPGGHIAVSFWQFMQDEEYAGKVEEFHNRAIQELSLTGLEPGDYILGWRNEPGVFRYCHHFSDAEIGQLLEAVVQDAKLVLRYSADGKSGQMNCYLVLQKY